MNIIKSVLHPTKVQYEWTISHLQDYFDFIDEHQILTLSSEEFKINHSNDYTLFLKLTISAKSISCSLHRCPNTRFRALLCQLQLKSGHVELITVNLKKDFLAHIEDLGTVVLRSNYSLSNRKDLFLNDELTAKCVLTILNDSAKIEPSYTPIPCQLMKDHFKELLESGNGSDITFEVDGTKFKAHKSILLARSPVFAAMFQHNMLERNTNRVKIVDISRSTFDLLLHFIYTDEIKTQLNVETGINLLQAASKYQLDGLQNLCAPQLLKLMTVFNASKIRNMAEAHNLTNFVSSIDAFIKSYPKYFS